MIGHGIRVTNHRAETDDRASEPRAGDERTSSPDPDDSRKPAELGDISKRSWLYIARKTLREFSDDQCTDLAAALTYYAILALFPALLALVSLLGVVGQAQKSVNAILDILKPLVSDSTIKTLEPVLHQLANSQGAGLGVVIGVLGALWSASGYVGAFSRAMNRIYEIREGRPIWKLRPQMLLVTLVAVVLAAVIVLILVVSGPIAQSIGDYVGLGSTAVLIWQIAKWPVLALAVMLIVAILYYATPNVKQPKFRWISVGAAVAIVVWVIASVAFGFYVSHFSSYNKTYGSLAGVIVFLLWLWITNLALLFGAELDAELERGRELQAGLPAEENIQLPPRDERNIEKSRRKEEEYIAKAREIRQDAARSDSNSSSSSND
jgi:membrane protein